MRPSLSPSCNRCGKKVTERAPEPSLREVVSGIVPAANDKAKWGVTCEFHLLC
jgi:hypothetical protein